jgi:hypothetical protein
MINHAVHQQWNRDSEWAAEKVSKDWTAKTQKIKPTTDESKDGAVTLSS